MSIPSNADISASTKSNYKVMLGSSGGVAILTDMFPS